MAELGREKKSREIKKANRRRKSTTKESDTEEQNERREGKREKKVDRQERGQLCVDSDEIFGSIG